MSREELLAFELVPGAVPVACSEKDSMLISSRSRAIQSQRNSVLTDKMGSDEVKFGHELEFLYR